MSVIQGIENVSFFILEYVVLWVFSDVVVLVNLCYSGFSYLQNQDVAMYFVGDKLIRFFFLHSLHFLH